uniref:C-type lysozyme 2 n=1 Tax=Mytilus galloprovincialis TaxID=29158 RepID=A0A0C5PIW0_MYTGA|nr:C-type lysozyme 2 [Mytilus galloprovincialis]
MMDCNSVMVLFALLGCSYAGTISKCDVVKALRAESVPDSDLRDWLCLVEHESSFRYELEHVNSDKSIDYGIFQLNNKYWCDRPTPVDTSKCWKFNTCGCTDTCTSLIDSDISNDAKCAVQVKNCNDFDEWYGWRDHCANVQSSEYDFSDC